MSAIPVVRMEVEEIETDMRRGDLGQETEKEDGRDQGQDLATEVSEKEVEDQGPKIENVVDRGQGIKRRIVEAHDPVPEKEENERIGTERAEKEDSRREVI